MSVMPAYIHTCDTYHRDGAHAKTAELLKLQREKGIRQAALKLGINLPGGLGISGGTAVMMISGGAWVVKCPDPNCNGAGLAREDGLFYCVSCYNVSVGHKYLRSTFPPNRQEIEAELVRRPYMNRRNWLPSESVADLQAENLAHGVK